MQLRVEGKDQARLAEGGGIIEAFRSAAGRKDAAALNRLEYEYFTHCSAPADLKALSRGSDAVLSMLEKASAKGIAYRKYDYPFPTHDDRGTSFMGKLLFLEKVNSLVVVCEGEHETDASLANTLFHESVRATGYTLKRFRQQPEYQDSIFYALEELVAETGAILLAARLKMYDQVEYNKSAQKVKHYENLIRHRVTKSDLDKVYRQATKAVDYLLA